MSFKEIRDLTIAMHGLKNMDTPYQFYYDETNNIRKFHIDADGSNIEEKKIFVLGGIVFQSNINAPNIADLFKNLNLHSNIVEVKFKHIGKGDFLDILKSSRLEKVLSWTLNENLFIHYKALDIMYWATVDIVDSIIDSIDESNIYHDFYVENHHASKQLLYSIASSNEELFLQGLFKFDYPDLSSTSILDFIKWLIQFTDQQKSFLPSMFTDEHLNVFKTLLKLGLKADSLPFIMEEKKDILLETFADSYFNQVYLFNSSNHTFDNEEQIEPKLAERASSCNQSELGTYQFVDSKQHLEIQLSDILCGFLGKYFTFIKDHSEEELSDYTSVLNEKQANNLTLLDKLIKKSDTTQPAFLNTIQPGYDKYKSEQFLNSFNTTPNQA